MPRPRTVSDDDILDRAVTLVSASGPQALTFGALGKLVGLAPATLVQRHGTREALLRATLLRMWDRLDEATRRSDELRPLSVDGAVALLVGLSGQYESPDDDGSQGLLLLREDFRDPVLRARGVEWGDALARALGRRITDEPAAELVLGRMMASHWQVA